MSAFSREALLLGQDAVSSLSRRHVAVFGLGGVGGYAAEALARAGIGTLTLVDEDTFSESNINRQCGALMSTVGLGKARVMAERITDINPSANVIPMAMRYSAETRALFDFASWDYILDAIDLVSCKLDLIQTAIAAGIPIISALGTGNRLDPTRFRVTDISKTRNCPLARVIRKELRARGIERHRVVFSDEDSIKTHSDETPPPGRRSIPGSVSWVPGAAGFVLAGAVVTDLISSAK